MAEVFLALQEGIGGFEKLVVVKRIFGHFSADQKFVRMFLDEARLAASIRHQNVVQILDIGRDEDGFFIVMEYLSGETVGYLFEALRARGRTVPPHIACRIGAEIAAGLHHAHTATDAAGNPQPIVHRDVTPSNLIVCFNGVVKVVDFGVAKATLAEGHTKAGSIKGKMSYLTPEQIEGRPIDGRTDVFQLGICLHEMLTGRRLFRGSSDEQRMMAVMERRIPPPGELAPSVPRPLDEVVLWALQRDPARRPQSADQLRRELENVLVQIGMTVSDHDLGEWMSQTLPERRAERLAMERASAAEMRSDRGSSDRLLSTSSDTAMAPLVAPAEEGSGRRTPTLATSVQRPQQTGSASLFTPRQGWIVGGILAAFIAVVSVSAWQLGESPDEAAAAEPAAAEPASHEPAAVAEDAANIPAVAALPEERRPVEPVPGVEAPPDPAPGPTFEVKVVAVPVEASIELDGEKTSIGSLTESLVVDGREHVLVVRAEGYQTRTIRFVDAPPPEVVRLERARRPRPPGEPRAGGAAAGRKPDERATTEKGERRPLTDNLDPWAD